MLKSTRSFTTLTQRSINHLKQTTEKFNERTKGTIVEKWVNYWKSVGKDYKDVALSVRDDFKTYPVKSSLKVAGLGLLALCGAKNPNQRSFRSKYIQCANDVALVSSSIVNPRAVDHLKYIENCYNANLIRYTNLGLFSIIWVDNHSEDCKTYESNCSYLKIQYSQFFNHVLDVGFFNIWWNISRKMLDYDINY